MNKTIKIIILFIVVLPKISYLYGYQERRQFYWSEPLNMSRLNSTEDDFAPQWNKYENLLYFNSNIEGKSRFFTSVFTDSLNFSNSKLLAGELNRTNGNISYISFESPDIAYISAFRLNDTRSFLNIFELSKRKNSWDFPALVDNLAGDSYNAQASVSPDGKVLVFSSDRSGVGGDADLWISYKQENGTWGIASAITELNTPGFEISPFLASRDTLYFASDGHEGPGGYDLFVSVFEDGVWQRPNPLSELNTKYDESDFVLLPNNYAVFTSNRTGGKGKLDLYLTHLIQNPIIEIKQSAIEFSIAAQVTEVKIVNRTIVQSIPVAPYIILDRNVNEIITEIQNSKSKNDNSFSSFDSVYHNNISIIGNKLAKNPNAKIILIPKIDGFKYKEQDIKLLIDAVKKALQLSDDRIIIKPVFTDKRISNSILFFESDAENIFAEVESSAENISISPSILDLNIDARPRKEAKSWECNLLINNKKIPCLDNKMELPAQFSVDLKPMKELINSADSMLISISGKDSSEGQSLTSYTLYVNHTATKENRLLKINNINYEQYVIFMNADGKQIKNKYYPELIKNIGIISSGSMRIIIQCQMNNQNSKKMAEQLKAEFKKSLGKSPVKVDIEDYKDNTSTFDKIHNSYIISILFEKN